MRIASMLMPAMLLIAAAAHTALAQPNSPLSGPKVQDGSVPGEQRKFTGGKSPRERMTQETPHRLFMNALNVLRGEKATESVRLSDSQETRLKEINAEFQASVAAYRKEHMEEARALMPKLAPQDRRRVEEFLGRRAPQGPQGPNGPRPAQDGSGKGKRPQPGMDGTDRPRPNGPPPDMDMKSPSGGGEGGEEAMAARGRMRELIEGAPKPSDTHTQMYALLTSDQKPVVQAELERLRKEVQDRRGMNQGKRPENGKKPQGSPPGKRLPPPPASNRPPK